MGVIVQVRAPSGELVSIDGVILRACSPVLDGILGDGDASQPQIIDMSDAESDESLTLFLQLASLTSHKYGGEPWTAEQTAENAPSVMPLIHKYDAKGLLAIVQQGVNEYPSSESLQALIKYRGSEDDDGSWISTDALDFLLRDMSWKQQPRRRTPFDEQDATLKELPTPLLRRLLLHVLNDHRFRIEKYL